MTIRELIRPAGLAGLFLALPLITPSEAAAQDAPQSVEPKVFYACYVPGSGTVYRIKEPGTPTVCGKNGQNLHIEFSWTDGAGGGSGAQGPEGPMGPQGPKGDTGEAGPQGEKGDQGEPGAGGVSAHNMLTGLSADDHAQYLLTSGMRQSQGFAVTGSYGNGMLPVTGTGIRMMWHPAKAAFRAGNVEGNLWDEENVGTNSIAFGVSPVASGNNSFAIHWGKATGDRSFAFGPSAEASGTNAIAFGTAAEAVGGNSFATSWSKARGVGSVAFSNGEAFAVGAMAWQGTATGVAGLALGSGTLASGQNSAAFGTNTTASGPNSTATGVQTLASGERSTAMGSLTTASGAYSTALGVRASTSNRQGAFIYGDNSSAGTASNSRDNQFAVRAQHFWLGNTNGVTHTAGRFLETSTGAYLSHGGTWTNSSDVNVKHNFEVVDTEQVLRKIAALPITTWSYRTENADVRHMGPMAQDFRAAFGLGDSDRAIATVDIDGVALAAIKALDARSREQDARIAELEATVAALLNVLGQK